MPGVGDLSRHVHALVATVRRDIRPGLYLVSLTCGIIDATCLLALGGVFAEMMTGNILLMAVTLGSSETHGDAARFLWPLLSFAVGATLGGRLLRFSSESEDSRVGFLLVWSTIVGSAAVCWLVEPAGNSTIGRSITALLALSMGTHTALLRRHGVQDLATNVMTLTLTAVMAEIPVAGGRPKNMMRRVLSIACFFCGGVLGAFLLRFGTYAALGAASIVYMLALVPLLSGAKPEEAPHEATRAA